MSAPIVFISYSHDSPEHKAWVESLAMRLRRNGIDATLDQWDASPGDDLTMFMERGLTDSERVLVVCTPKYVVKAEEGIGGVGYERLIVTAELAKKIATNKFIPVIRNALPEQRTPKFLATRKFVDFSDGVDEDATFEELLRELHKAPPKGKPPIGANPYAQSALGEELPKGSEEKLDVEVASAGTNHTALHPGANLPQIPLPPTAADAYRVSRTLATSGDAVQWQRLSRQINADSFAKVVKWRDERESGRPNIAQLVGPLLDEAVESLAPIFCFSLAAVESGRQSFSNQTGLLFDILDIPGWKQAGMVWFVNLPATFVFVFHHLHGALCAYTGQFNVGLQLVERKLQSIGVREFRRLCDSHELLGWPPAFDTDSLKGWSYILSAPSRWGWLLPMFETNENYAEALVAYRMLLNIHELVLLLEKGESLDSANPQSMRLDVPLNFALEGRELNQRAFKLLLQHPEQIVAIWESRGRTTKGVKAVWPKWMEVCNFWVSRSNRAMFFGGELAHAALFDAL